MDREGLVGIASGFLEEIDRAVGAAVRSIESGGMRTSCEPGCAACCRLPVESTYAEGALVADHILGKADAGMQEELRGRLTAWAEWSRAGLVDMLSGGMDPVRAYLYHGPGCPFLSEGICEVYPVRPAGCRIHLSVSEPAGCMPPEDGLPVFFNPGSVRGVNESVRPVIERYMRDLERAGLDPSRPVEPLPLTVLAHL